MRTSEAMECGSDARGGGMVNGFNDSPRRGTRIAIALRCRTPTRYRWIKVLQALQAGSLTRLSRESPSAIARFGVRPRGPVL